MVEVGLLAYLIATRAIGKDQHIQHRRAEWIGHHRLVAYRDDVFYLLGVGAVGIKANHRGVEILHGLIRGRRAVVLVVGVAIV